MDTINVPLHLLDRDPLNVRHIEASKIDELAVSIKEHGLLLPLIVRPANDRYLVTAGSRRLLALKILVGALEIPDDWPVPCRVLHEEKNARELSLVENVMRQAMHPADLYAAFAKLKIGGQKNKEIAERFSLPEKDVKRVLALGKITPKLMDLWRKDAFDYGDATIIAQLTPEQQAKLVADAVKMEENGKRVEFQHWHLQQMLRDDRIYPTDERVKAVGLDVYKKAGGKMGSDLFEEKEAYLTDGKLLDRLIAEKHKTIIAEWKAKGWGKVQFRKRGESMYGAPAGLRSLSDKEAKSLYREQRKKGTVLLDYDYKGDVVASCCVPADVKQAMDKDRIAADAAKVKAPSERMPQFTIEKRKKGSKARSDQVIDWHVRSWTHDLSESHPDIEGVFEAIRRTLNPKTEPVTAETFVVEEPDEQLAEQLKDLEADKLAEMPEIPACLDRRKKRKGKKAQAVEYVEVDIAGNELPPREPDEMDEDARHFADDTTIMSDFEHMIADHNL